jgi:hypothetical protein
MGGAVREVEARQHIVHAHRSVRVRRQDLPHLACLVLQPPHGAAKRAGAERVMRRVGLVASALGRVLRFEMGHQPFPDRLRDISMCVCVCI